MRSRTQKEVPKDNRGAVLSKGIRSEEAKAEEYRRVNQAQQENLIISQIKENPNIYGKTEEAFDSTEQEDSQLLLHKEQ